MIIINHGFQFVIHGNPRKCGRIPPLMHGCTHVPITHTQSGTHTHTHIHTNTHTNPPTYPCTHTHMQTHVHAHNIHTTMHTPMHVHTHTAHVTTTMTQNAQEFPTDTRSTDHRQEMICIGFLSTQKTTFRFHITTPPSQKMPRLCTCTQGDLSHFENFF